MVEEDLQSYIFDFSRVDSFYEHLNIDFNISDMVGSEGNANFEFVLSEHSPNNIEECLDNDGCLNSSVDDNITEDVPLLWTNNDDGTNQISIDDDVEFTFGDTIVQMKALFLREKTSGYVLGFCINMNTVSVTNKMVFEEDTILWTVSDGGYHG